MSDKVYFGESWKSADDKPSPNVRMPRAQLQSLANRDYAIGRISLDRWRARSEVIGHLRRDGSSAAPQSPAPLPPPLALSPSRSWLSDH